MYQRQDPYNCTSLTVRTNTISADDISDIFSVTTYERDSNYSKASQLAIYHRTKLKGEWLLHFATKSQQEITKLYSAQSKP